MKLHNLDIYKHMTTWGMIKKLNEEVGELMQGIFNNDVENIKEEMMDVIQCIYGIAYTRGIDLEDCVEAHNKKLEDRFHKFLD